MRAARGGAREGRVVKRTAAVVLLGVFLVACSGAGDTTCAEWSSAGERQTHIVKDALDDRDLFTYSEFALMVDVSSICSGNPELTIDEVIDRIGAPDADEPGTLSVLLYIAMAVGLVVGVRAWAARRTFPLAGYQPTGSITSVSVSGDPATALDGAVSGAAGFGWREAERSGAADGLAVLLERKPEAADLGYMAHLSVVAGAVRIATRSKAVAQFWPANHGLVATLTTLVRQADQTGAPSAASSAAPSGPAGAATGGPSVSKAQASGSGVDGWILDHLARGRRDTAALVAASGRPQGDVLAALDQLVKLGRVRFEDGSWGLPAASTEAG